VNVLNPSNIDQGAYNIDKVPAREGRSRFALSRTAEGWPATSTTEAVNSALERLLAERRASAPELAPPSVSVELKYAQLINGAYLLLPRGSVTGILTRGNTRPSKFSKRNGGATAGALIDLLFLDRDARIRDDQAWEALRDTAEQEGARGNALRQLNDLVAELVCLRAGLLVRPDELPPPPTTIAKER
jgi:hypothetical protein